MNRTTTPPPASPATGEPVRRRWGLWAEADFRRLWIGETTSSLGTAVGHVSLSLVAVVVLKADPATMGVLTALTWLPWLLIGLPAGAWVDRWPRRRVMLVSDLALLVLFASVPVAAWLGVLTIGQLLVVAVLVGVAKVFLSTAYAALIPTLVAKPDLLEANAKLRGGETAGEIAGPGVAGFIAQVFGAVGGLLVDSFSYLVSALCLGAIKPREKPPAAAARDGIRREISEGIRFVVRDPYLRTLACFGALGNLALNGIQAVQTVFLVRDVHLDGGAVGLVFAAVSTGGLAGVWAAGRIVRRFGTARGLLLSYLVVAPGIVLLPFAGSGLPLPVSVLGWALGVGGVVTANVISSSFSQSYCPPEMLGRVRASSSTVNYGAIPVGALLGGYLGEALGTRGTIWIMAGVLVTANLVLLVSPIRALRDFPQRAAAPRTDA
ncbi:MFS transporter [Streptomyces celluloflavus]|uniref:MFS transporter n=1 Tax=Streptomyces celluloflavus TaxID=58344 RepID=UPI0036B837FD